MSRPESGTYRHSRGFPRVSGDEPAAEKSFRRKLEFSPRERG